jgi:Immunity protein 10
VIEFVARRCAVAELEDVSAFVIVLYDDRDDPDLWLEVQKSLDVDEEDKELGMNGYCVCTSDGATHYGGIQSCSLSRDVFELRFSEDAEQVLGFDHLTVHLDLPESEKIALRDGLERVFKDDPARPAKLILE